jgi:hypothetical protein
MDTEDKVLQAKQVKAAKYAAEPDRFTLLNIQYLLKVEDGNVVVEHRAGTWDCTCGDYHYQSPCAHMLAVRKVLRVNITLP